MVGTDFAEDIYFIEKFIIKQIIIILFFFHLNMCSVQKVELSFLQEFSLNLQAVEDVIATRVGESLQVPNVSINLSPLLKDSVFCPIDLKCKSLITIREFLNKFITRWDQEIQYQQKILYIKDQIINEFDGLSNKTRDEKVVDLIKKQSQQIVETLFTKTNLDKKQLAGDFCKSFMNGFDVEMIEKINIYATYTVWTPFIAPQPVGLIEFMKKTFYEEIGEEMGEARIANASAKIMQYIEDQLKDCEIQIQSGLWGMIKRFTGNNIILKEKNIIAVSQLKRLLTVAQINKKACNLFINEIGNNDKIIANERTKIQNIYVKMKIKEFLKAKISFTYEYLELEDLEDENNLEQINQILLKLPKCLKSSCFRFKKNKQNEVKIIKNEQKNLYELSLSFIYVPQSKGVNEEIKAFSNVFKHSTVFQHLYLDFTDASITTGAIDNLAISLQQVNQITFLFLAFGGNFGNNSANNISIKLFAQAISQMIKLNYLLLAFWGAKHKITDDGIAQLSRSFNKLTNIQQLILGFGNGNNGVSDNAIDELSRSITSFSNLYNLRLDFSYGHHAVTDNGVQSLSEALIQFTKLNKLHLNFCGGNNSVSDKGIGHLSESIASLINLQLLGLLFAEGNHKVSDEGMKRLSESMSELKELKDMDLRFFDGKHCIGDTAMQSLGASLTKNQQLTRLNFNFRDGKNFVTDKGIIEISRSLTNLNHIEDLTLYFSRGNHKISNKGVQALATTIKKLSNLTILDLSFMGGNNTISREGIDYLAEALLTINSSLEFECHFIGYPNTVTQEDIDYLESIRSYSKFDGNQ